MVARKPNSLQHSLLPMLVCSLAILKWKRIQQLKLEIDSRTHPAITFGVENEVTIPNFIVGFGTSSVHTSLMICFHLFWDSPWYYGNLPVILSTVLFTNELGSRTNFASWNVVINVLFCNERGCNLERASAVDIKGSTENDTVCMKQCHLSSGVQRNCVYGGEQIQWRWDDREKGDLGAANGSGGSCNFVKEISLHISKLS